MSPERDPVAGVNRYGFELSDEEIAVGTHREKVGPDWEGLGTLQRDFLVGRGLLPTSRLLDVGCGALRPGVVLARLLLPGHYHGIDVNASLIRAALVHELLLAGLQDRVPAENRASPIGSSATSASGSTSRSPSRCSPTCRSTTSGSASTSSRAR